MSPLFHTPDRSARPWGVRGGGVPSGTTVSGGRSRAPSGCCAAAGAADSSAANRTATTIGPGMRVSIVSLLDLLGSGRSRAPVACRSHEQLLPARQLERPRVARLGPVSGLVALDRQLLAELQRVAVPALARHRIGRPALALPGRDGPVGIPGVQIDPDVRIAPLHLGDGAGDG